MLKVLSLLVTAAIIMAWQSSVQGTVWSSQYNVVQLIPKIIQTLDKQAVELKKLQTRVTKLTGMLKKQDQNIANQNQVIADQNQKIADQNQKIADQNQKIANQDQMTANQNDRIANQDKDISSLNAVIADLKQELSEQKQKVELVKKSCNNKYKGKIHNTFYPSVVRPSTDGFKDDIKENSTTTDFKSYEIDKEMETVGTNEKNLRIKRSPQTIVAFHAFLQHDMVNLAIGHIIKFGNTKVNYGSAYHPDIGVFECTVTGYYMFHWRLMAALGKLAYLVLMVNGHAYTVIYADSSDHFNSDSEVAFVFLNPGDHVWLETGHYISSLHESYSSFYGVLLFRA